MNIIIYGKEGCPYCQKAKELAAQLQEVLKNKVIYIDYLKAGLTKEDLSYLVGKEVKTLPQIEFETLNNEADSIRLIKREYIGGYTDFAQIVEDRKLFKSINADNLF